jgi:kynureninase
MPLPADRRRDDFPALQTGIHLLSHSLGPVPRAARTALATYVDLWEGQVREDVWTQHWWDLSGQVGDLIARVLGGRPGTVQVQPNSSVALSTVISCLDAGPGRRRKIVTSALDFPTTGYVWEAQRRSGLEVTVVPSEDGLTTPMGRLLDAIDETTALVSLSHVSYRSSHRLDPRPIVERARRFGALVLLDTYQSGGVLEMDADGWGVDFMIGGTIKWLCGGPACGYLYVRPDRIPTLEPRLTGWFAHAEPFSFEPAPIRYDASVRRFAQGTANIPGLYSCREGLRIVLEVGLAAIAAESRRRTDWLVEAARERGLRVNSPPAAADRGGAVMIDVERPGEIALRLRERSVLVDWRPGVGLRLGPHFFNTDDEVRETMDILARLLA